MFENDSPEICLQDVKSDNTSAVGMPGRNMCNFLCLFNFALWLIVTFECQNITSSAVEAQGTILI